MYDRELTQLISAAQYYLDAAESLQVPGAELARTVSADSDQWPADRVPHDLSPLDTYSAHLASCAMRLATIREILVGDARKRERSHMPILRTSEATTSSRQPPARLRSCYATTWAMQSTTPTGTREPRFGGPPWPNSRTDRWAASSGVAMRCSRTYYVEQRMPNTPFHLTPTSLPSVARSGAGERQRYLYKTGGAR